MEGPNGTGKMVNCDHKKLVGKRYATTAKGVLEYIRRPSESMMRPGDLTAQRGRNPAVLCGIDQLI